MPIWQYVLIGTLGALRSVYATQGLIRPRPTAFSRFRTPTNIHV